MPFDPFWKRASREIKRTTKEELRLFCANSVDLIDQLQSIDESGEEIYWRFQPKGLLIGEHKSIDYTGEGELTGVWAFVSLENALANMFDPLESYIELVEGDGGDVELVAIKAARSQDGPEASVIILEGEIVGRFDARRVMSDEGVWAFLLAEGWVEEEDFENV